MNNPECSSIVAATPTIWNTSRMVKHFLNSIRKDNIRRHVTAYVTIKTSHVHNFTCLSNTC